MAISKEVKSVSKFFKDIKSSFSYTTEGEDKVQSGYKRDDKHSVHFDSIIYVEDENIRKINNEQVEALIVSFRNGGVPKELILEPAYEDGKPVFFIVGGHHTYLALRELILNESYNPMVKTTLFRGTAAERVILAFNDNQQEKMTPLENARAFQSMLDEGLTKTEIHKKTGKTLSFISDALFLLNADDELIQMIEDGQISPSKARRILREYGTNNATAAAKFNLGLANVSVETFPEKPVITGTAIEGELVEDNKISEKSGETKLVSNADVNINSTESTEAKQLQRAAKKAITLRKLSAGKTNQAVELITALNARVDGGKIELNPILLEQLANLANEIEEIRKHNRVLQDAENATRN